MTHEELRKYIDTALSESLDAAGSKNPLEAVTQFIQVLDCRLCRRVGDDLEKRGRNRYTGEKERTDTGFRG